MHHQEYFNIARDLLSCPAAGEQRQANLRFALHTTYVGTLRVLATSCADAVIGEFPSDRQSLPWITVYRAAAATADETGLLNVDVAWCGEHVTEFAAGFTQLHRYRGIMEEGPGVMVEEQHILGALSLADESIAHLEACDPAQVDAFAVAVILPN